MKSIVVLYSENNSYAQEKVFGGKSAFDLTNEWAAKAGDEVVVLENKIQTTGNLFKLLSEIVEEKKADFVIFSYGDLPFINQELTQQLINNHIEYNAEYSFADGYPYGFTPEIIDGGTVKILNQLAQSTFLSYGEKEFTRDGIFEFLKADINSFEIESLLAPKDYRLFRLNFSCQNKDSFLSCKSLYEVNIENKTTEEICDLAIKNPKVLKTVPGFYNIQISDKSTNNCIYCPYACEYEKKGNGKVQNAENFMEKENFYKLIEEIHQFSENAVISLSAWGDCAENPYLLNYIEYIVSFSGLSVYLELNGKYITKEFCNGIEEIKNKIKNSKGANGFDKIMISVPLDACSQETYSKVHNTNESFVQAMENVKELAKVLPGNVYPMFVRMKENEEELEKFYRYWNDKQNGSDGKLIIQKYDSYQGLLPKRQVADLSPLDRDPCWHLRRDMTILTDGSVPLCKEYVLGGIIGNVFTDGLKKVWEEIDQTLIQHINENYNEKCRNCDEFYTYNF